MMRRELLKTAVVAGLGASAISLAAQSTGEQTSEEKWPSKAQMRETVLRYLTAWAEREPKRRHELVALTWVDEGTYIDHARQGRGHADISAMIAKAIDPFPGYRFALASGIEVHHEYVRFSWLAGGLPDTPLYFKGTDIGVFAPDGRFKSVVGFVDAAP